MDSHTDAEDIRQYRVVVNYEQQYSIWSADQAIPTGWHDTGQQGSRSACLAYIGQVWTDMRPLSLRQAMSAAGGEPQAPRDSGGRT